MTDSGSPDLERQLLARVVAGEITREEYDELLERVRIHQSSVSNFETASTGPSVVPDHPNPAIRSVGEVPTGASSARRLSAGSSLGKFQLLDRLGRGGMGEVWKAHDTVGDRNVVIKVLPPELSGNREELARVKDAFKKVHALNHENICPTYDLGHDADIGYYLVMQFLNARTLNSYHRAILKKFGKFPLNSIVSILRRAAAALDHSHASKVIHRDVKPENIMISANGKNLWLIDFGLAAEIQSSLARVSQIQMDRSGTYPYMAPEQWRGAFQDAKTDQYALAVVAYELITGRLPFEGDRFILERCVLNQPFPMIENGPEPVNRALARATAKNRDERFSCCKDFVEAMISEEFVSRADANIVQAALVGETPFGDFNQMSVSELQELAESGNPDALGELAGRYIEGKGVETNYEKALSLARKSAKQNSPKGQVALAGMYLFGFGLLQSDKDALFWMQKAQKQGSPEGQVGLGYLYMNGQAVPQDDRKAAHWFLKAAEQGDADGQHLIGFMFDEGRGVAHSHEKALRWYRMAADQNHALAQLSFGNMYVNGKGVEKDLQKAVKWIRRSADQGCDAAQYALGLMYFEGCGVAEDNKKACGWFKKAAEQGDAAGQCHLGIMYDNGYGVEQSDFEALYWYQKSAEQGYALGQHNYGCMLFRGQGIEQNVALAISWFQKAAEQGLAESQTELALMYLEGRGLGQDIQKAVRLLNQAVGKEDARARQTLGMLYEEGRGVEQNDAAAYGWYKLAAEQGRRVAQHDLARMYHQGKGVAKNMEEAVKWYRKAAEQGYQDSITALQQLENGNSGWGTVKGWFS